MSAAEQPANTAFDDLKPGDRIVVEQIVTDPSNRTRTLATLGTVVRTERAHSKLHFGRHLDDKASRDTILLEMPDGELTTVTIDEQTVLNRA